MSVSNGQLANATTFNTAFVSRLSTQTVAGGKQFQNYIATDSQDVASAATIAALSSAKSWVRITGATATDIQGISAGVNGQNIFITNHTNQNVTLKHQDLGASASDRLILPGASDLVILPNAGIELLYDLSQASWISADDATSDVVQTITNGDTTHSPSSDAVFDALATKSDVGHTHVAADITDFASAAQSAAVDDAIVNGVTDVAPSQNAVFDALALKEDLSNKTNDTALGNSSTLYPTQNAVKSYADNISIVNALIFG